MSNQDIDGKLPPDAAPGAAAPAGAPDTVEQQLAKEREARTLMRDRLRHTEALAAESHALRARMAQELEKVTADRDRLRSAAASAPPAGAPGAAVPPPAAGSRVDPPFTPRMMAMDHDAPLKPPAPPRRKGPWLALAMLGVVAATVGGVAWYTGSLPGDRSAPSTPVAMGPAAAVRSQPPSAAALAAPPAASTALASASPPTGAVALPPLTPEAQLAAAPTAAGSSASPAVSPADGPAPDGMPGRLRKALDGEGIAASVDVDAASGHVMVADPQADDALRQRTEMVIRAVYAGASLPEPQIEHRWLSPKRGANVAPVASVTTPAPMAAAPTPRPTQARVSTEAAQRAPSPAVADAVRHPADRARRTTPDAAVADAEELRPVLPSGRITASCMDGLAGKSAARRANMTACMKRSCSSSATAHNTEECRAYEKAYPFSSGPG